jgi:hypothetical protein
MWAPTVDTVTAARRQRGPTENAYERALAVARRSGRLRPEDAALVAAGRASARLVDDARQSTDPKAGWLVEAAIRRHVETLRELELTPGTRTNAESDPLAQALATFIAAEAHGRADPDQS